MQRRDFYTLEGSRVVVWRPSDGWGDQYNDDSGWEDPESWDQYVEVSSWMDDGTGASSAPTR